MDTAPTNVNVVYVLESLALGIVNEISRRMSVLFLAEFERFCQWIPVSM